MRQLGISPLGEILIIETKAGQISTNAIFVLQLENVRQNLVFGRLSEVGKPLTRYSFHLASWNGVILVKAASARIRASTQVKVSLLFEVLSASTELPQQLHITPPEYFLLVDSGSNVHVLSGACLFY